MRFDEDRDGSVTYAELIELMKYLKIDTKKSAALSILDDIDLNGKHADKISITLHQMWWQLNCHWSWRHLSTAFKSYVLFDFNDQENNYSLVASRKPSPIKNHLCKLSHIILLLNEAKQNVSCF